MTDTVPTAVRSAMMSAVRNKDTAPELAVRRALHAAGYRFRLHRRNLPGTPDIVLVRARIAVFVHGCFWHGHNCKRGRRPTSNVAFWDAKIDANVERDDRASRALIEAGWTPLTIWACEGTTGLASLLELLSRPR
jgi:DNA mismatch endonuclease, patch repair protein